MLFSLLQVVMVLYYTARPGLSIEVRRYYSEVRGGGQYSIYISQMIATKMSYIGLSSEVVDIYVRFSNSADAGVM